MLRQLDNSILIQSKGCLSRPGIDLLQATTYSRNMNINLSTRSTSEAKQLLKQQLDEALDLDVSAAVYKLLGARIDKLGEPRNGMCIQVTAQVVVEAEIDMRIE